MAWLAWPFNDGEPVWQWLLAALTFYTVWRIYHRCWRGGARLTTAIARTGLCAQRRRGTGEQGLATPTTSAARTGSGSGSYRLMGSFAFTFLFRHALFAFAHAQHMPHTTCCLAGMPCLRCPPAMHMQPSCLPCLQHALALPFPCLPARLYIPLPAQPCPSLQ